MKSVHEFAGLYTTTLLVDRSSWFFKALIMGHTVVHSALKSLKVQLFLSHFKSFKHFFRTNSTRGIERVLRKFFKNMLIFAIGVIVHCTFFLTLKHCAL